jgi:hypothetical protein
MIGLPVATVQPSLQAVGRVHRQRADQVPPEVPLHLERERFLPRAFHLERLVEIWNVVGWEFHIDNAAQDL